MVLQPYSDITSKTRTARSRPTTDGWPSCARRNAERKGNKCEDK